MIAEVFICLIVADFITGLVHWLEDTYGLPSWPLLGQAVIVPNIEHHQNPGFIGSMSSFLSRNYQSYLLLIIVSALVYMLDSFSWHFCLIGFFASLGNEVHAWNHRSHNAWWIELLQDTGIIQSRRQHALHHRPPYDRYFCTLTNFTNAVLERIAFWRLLEGIIALCGIPTQRGSTARGGY